MNWAGKKVLVTGSDGFIGSHLVERLVGLDADVRAFCFYNSNGSLGWLDQASKQVRDALDVRLGDIRDARFVEESLTGVDTVFHLAALIAIPYSYQAPSSFVDTNVVGTLNVLEGARRGGCRRVVQTSTSEVYGTPETTPITEAHPLQAQSPYSATKIAADKLAESFFRSYGLPVVTLRPFNTYGPRQSTRAVLPTILVQLLAGMDEIKLGRLDPKRDMTFVADTVDGFLAAGAVEGIEGEVIQLGTGEAISIGDLFATACRALGREARVIQEQARMRPEGSEVMLLLSNPGKAKALLDWEAKTPLEQGLRETADWLGRHVALYDANRYHV